MTAHGHHPLSLYKDEHFAKLHILASTERTHLSLKQHEDG